MPSRPRSVLVLCVLALAGCPGPTPVDVIDETPVVDTPVPTDHADVVTMDARDVPPVPDVPPPPPDGSVETCPALEEDPAAPTFCSLGTDVPGATVPAGFCLRRYALVGSPRVMAAACNGDVLVSAPMSGAPGGAGGGPGGIVLLTDDNHDGTAEQSMFVSRVADVHGITLGGGYLYYTTQNSVFRTPYTTGQRTAMGAPEDLHMPMRWGLGGRWTHGLARSVTGRLIGSRGEYGMCGGTPIGEIASVGMGTLDAVVTGFRNPMYLRCHYRDDACLAAELGEDQTPGAREKLLLVRSGTEFGYPCCFTTNAPMSARCAAVTTEDLQFTIGDTPFGFDWERGRWPASWRDTLMVALHGSFYTSPAWQGANIVSVPTDPATHVPRDTPTPFVQGFGPAGSPLERPADVVFSPDGRMFFADDLGNAVYWVAPTTLHLPRAR